MIIDTPIRAEGMVGRDGSAVAYQTFGEGRDVILLVPDWAIVHSASWHLQVALLARDHTVVTFDGRGSGASDRPVDPLAYAPEEGARDALEVLDVAGVERAVVISTGVGTATAALLAATHPQRVTAAVFIGSTIPFVALGAERIAAEQAFDRRLDSHTGWLKWNRDYWQRDWWGFLAFYAAVAFPEPASESFIRYLIELGLGTSPAVAAAAVDAPRLAEAEARRVIASIDCPVLVIHGAADAVAPLGNGVELARLARAGLHILPGAGHHPELRHADQTHALIGLFLRRALAAVG